MIAGCASLDLVKQLNTLGSATSMQELDHVQLIPADNGQGIVPGRSGCS
jgi:hypothetical protein